MLKRHARRLEALAQWVMVLGIVALVQPWNPFLHRYGVTIILIGLAAFMVFSHVPSPEPEEE
jgi:hypothetical protein